MAEVYRSAPLQVKSDGGALVIHCSDPRYQPHFQDFLKNGLHLDRYALIAVPGGPQFFALDEYLPKFSWAGSRWTKFMMELMKPARVILMQHDDCRWYLDGRFPDQGRSLRERQADDLARARVAIAEQFAGCRCELYYARLEQDAAAFELL